MTKKKAWRRGLTPDVAIRKAVQAYERREYEKLEDYLEWLNVVLGYEATQGKVYKAVEKNEAHTGGADASLRRYPR